MGGWWWGGWLDGGGVVAGGWVVCDPPFLAHLVYQPRSLLQSCFVHCASLALSLLVSFVHTSPNHRLKHRNFIFGSDM